MAALNEPYPGDMQGVHNADFSCYRQSQRAGLKGTFRAFLTSRVQNMDSIVGFQERELPVVNTKVRKKSYLCTQSDTRDFSININSQGEVLFSTWKSIFSQGGSFLQQPRIYSFNGKNVLTDLTW